MLGTCVAIVDRPTQPMTTESVEIQFEPEWLKQKKKGTKITFSKEELLGLHQPTSMPEAFKDFALVASVESLQPVALLPAELQEEVWKLSSHQVTQNSKWPGITHGIRVDSHLEDGEATIQRIVEEVEKQCYVICSYPSGRGGQRYEGNRFAEGAREWNPPGGRKPHRESCEFV